MIIACFMSVTFDEHITKITIKNGASGEGEEVDFTTSPVNQVAFPPSGTEIVVYFADGYEYDKTNINFIPTLEEYTYPTQSWDASTQTLTVTGHSDGSGTVAIKSKAIVQKQTIDVSELSGWANLATGNHQITIKTKASGYVDSAASNAVTVSKAASVSAGKLYFSFATLHDDTGGTGTVTVNDVEVSSGHQLSFGDVIKILPENNGDTVSYTINGQSVMGLTDGSFVVNWTEGGDITYSEVGFGPGGATATTVNYLNPTT